MMTKKGVSKRESGDEKNYGLDDDQCSGFCQHDVRPEHRHQNRCSNLVGGDDQGEEELLQ
jgi:hypothetical protein